MRVSLLLAALALVAPASAFTVCDVAAQQCAASCPSSGALFGCKGTPFGVLTACECADQAEASSSATAQLPSSDSTSSTALSSSAEPVVLVADSSRSAFLSDVLPALLASLDARVRQEAAYDALPSSSADTHEHEHEHHHEHHNENNWEHGSHGHGRDEDMESGCAVLSLATFALFAAGVTCCIRAGVLAARRSRSLQAPHATFVILDTDDVSAPLICKQ